jgi:hypothetical protein
MNPRQEKESKHILIWRDSVAAGDDVFAPHEVAINVEYDERIERTLEKIVAARYLPSILGGKATWIVIGKKPVAVIAQQWREPHYFVESTTRTEDLIESTDDHQLEFLYWCQVEPGQVVESLEQGKPLPDKYGRE